MILIESIRSAFSQIKSNRYYTFAAVGIISVSLLVFGMFLLALFNLKILSETLKKDMQVIVYFDNNISSERLSNIKDEISSFKEVENIVYISKEHAIEILSRDLLSIREMVNELKENPLPDSFRISLTGNSRNPEGITALVERLKGIKDIHDIDYGGEWVERLNVLISSARVIGIVVGGIMILLVIFIVSNTIKFTLLTRSKEIEIMKFAGATNMFIKVPFILEGGVLGLTSAIVSILMLFSTYKLILYKIPAAAYVWLGGIEFQFIPWEAVALIISTGILLGCFGSWVSVGRYLGVAIILFLCLNNNIISYAKIKNPEVVESQGIDEKIEENQKRLEDIDKQIIEKKKESKKAAVEEQKVKQDIEHKEKNLSSKKRNLKEVDVNILSKEGEIGKVKGDIDLISSDIDAKKKKMEDFLRYVYRSHISLNRGVAGIFLSSTDYHDFILRSKYEDILIGEANRTIRHLGTEVEALDSQVSLLNSRHQALLAEKGTLLKDKETIEKDVRANRVRLVSIQEKKTEYEKELKRLADTSAALKSLITSYEKKRSLLLSVNTGFEKEKGRLMWPLKGDVVSKFGRQKHPEFDAYIYKKGIEIASNSERDVKAVYNGVVAYADSLRGYGLIVIIDHGKSYYSVYAHASRLLVFKGNRVKEGDVIAISGNDNSSLSDREGIYFELRYNGQPVDPLAWLSSANG